jgi:hypothetical protein
MGQHFFGAPPAGTKSRRTLAAQVDGLPVQYLLNLPGGYNPGKAWPLFIALHGGGAGAGDENEAMSTVGYAMASFGAIAAAPRAPELIDGAWNCPRGYRVVRALIEEIGQQYHVDWDRVYVGGHSMGGYGSYFEAVWWPDRFAGCLSSAGGVSAGCVCDFIGMMTLKPKCYIYREIPGAGHALDDKIVRQALADVWKNVRNPYPKKVVCVCPNYWDFNPGREMGAEATGRAFWVEILERNGRDFDTPAKVVAELGPEPNTITVSTPPVRRAKHKGPADPEIEILEMASSASKIGICLAEDFVDLSKPVKIVCNGRVVHDDFVNRSAEFLLEHVRRTGDPGMPFCARVEFRAN